MEQEKKYKVWPVIRRLMRDLRHDQPVQTPRIIFYTIFAGVFPFFAVILPKLAIGILEQSGENAERDLIYAMLIYFAVYGIFGYFRQRLEHSIRATNMRQRIMYLCKLSKKTMTMDYCHVENAKFWEENDRALNAANNNDNGMEGMLNRIFVMPAELITLIGMIVLGATLSPFVMLALILHVGVMMWISRSDHNYRYARKKDSAKLSRKMKYYEKTSTDFAYGKDIRIYNLRERILCNYHAEIIAYRKLIKKFAAHKYFISLLGILTLLITDGLMYGILIYKTMHGMPISSFSMYVTLTTSLMAQFVSFGESITFLRNEGQYVGDSFRLIDENLCKEGEKEFELSEGETLEIVFDHVDFKYPGSDTYIYKDLNFTIHKGERLAIVGINGAGKSTLVKMMTGLFEPTAGHIYLNGVDITEIRKQDLYDLYSAVFQDVNILAFPIRENVTGASEEVEEERVIHALDSVGLWDKVQGFEKGLDQMMLKIIDEEGTDFSGGERQKLSIARGLYKDGPMVIMDEPTAALDALAEAEIYESFSNMVQGKTAVYISHRLASTKFCDKIALFDKTGLIEYGTHDELMEQEGEYYRMFVIQGKYYQEEVTA